MRKCILTILILITWAIISTGQNLVPNPSFEIHTSCPTGGSQISLATPWYGVTTNSTDYFNACGTGGTSVPTNGSFDYQFARTGSSYAGMWVYQGNYREYIQVKLDSVLELDTCYYVEFYCNLHNSSGYGINKMAAGISVTPINTTIMGAGSGSALTFIPQIVSNQFIIDTLSWVRVAGYYKANGGEQYITIGNFNSYSTTDTLGTGYPGVDPYYYIDDVLVIKVPGCDTVGVGISEDINNSSFKLYPNPTNQFATLEFSNPTKQNCTLTLYDLRGQVLRTMNNITTDKVEIERQNLASGLYFFQLRTDTQILATGKLTIE